MRKKEKQTAPKSHKPGAFTLIELVVIITILAILATIGFLATGGYSSRARDSERLADVSQVSKSLDLQIVSAGSYPNPDNAFTITYSGGAIWNQGIIGNEVIQRFHTSISGGGLGQKPLDPLKKTEYVYSTLAYGKAYQIKTDYEGDLGQTAMEFIQTAFAAPGNPTVAYIKGNFAGVVAKTTTGSTTCVLAIPSIVTSLSPNSGTKVEVTTGTLSGTLLFNGKNLKNASSFNPTTTVYCGNALPVNDATGQISNMVQNIQNAYSGSDIASNQAQQSILSIQTGGTINMGNDIITNQLDGKLDGSNTTYKSCTGATYLGYTVLALGHGQTRNSTKTGALANGVLNYSLPTSCANGVYSYGTETSTPGCNNGYTWNGSICVDQTAPTITSVTYASPACNTIRFTINGATDPVAMHATPYSFDGGATWQASSYKDYSGTSYTLAANVVKVRDAAGNIYTHVPSTIGSAPPCLDCALPWGGTLTNGNSTTAYASSSVSYPTSCSSQTRTCTNGALSGSYGNSSCSVSYSYGWNYDDWSDCSGSCGGSGTMSRSVWCERSDGTVVANANCGGGKPGSSTSCSVHDCYNGGGSCTPRQCWAGYGCGPDACGNTWNFSGAGRSGWCSSPFSQVNFDGTSFDCYYP